MLSLAPRSLRPAFSALLASAVFALLAASTLLSAGSLKAQTTPSASTTALRGIPDRLTRPIKESDRVVLQGTLHPLANKANDRGAVSDGMKLNRMQILLKRSGDQESTLKRLIGEMHSPGSANYHKWLTPDQFGKQFGPSDADVAKLESWLVSRGFSISTLNPGRQTLEFSGTAGQFRDTFHAQVHSYQVKGETRFANASAPEIPAALAPVFGGFASLNNFPFKSQAKVLGKAQFDPATHVTKPNWTDGSANAYNLVLAPGDFNVQYDLNPLYAAGTKGDGQTIAIINESNINIAQVNNYRSTFGLPFNPPQVIIDGNDPGIDGINSPYGPNDASGEAYLDVELAGAVAPNAQIDLVIADDTELQDGLALAIERAVYSNIAPIISISFGGCEHDEGSFNATINGLWEQAAAQGITVLVSSGDAGSAACDDDKSQYYAVRGQAVNGFASTPFNVAVGGTDFYYSQYAGTAAALDAQLATYWNLTPSNDTPTVSLLKKVPEQPWNDSQFGLNIYPQYAFNGTTSIAGGGGGASTCGLPTIDSTTGSVTACAPYPKPSWQTGTGVPNDHARDLPDVSLFAANGNNNTFYPICASDGDCEGGTEIQVTGVGGTSASTPAFAGIMALVNQKYGRQGQANYVLYPLAAQFPSAFNDVTVGTNTVPCAYSGSNIAPVNCQAVASPNNITVTDRTYGSATEGEIGLTANTPAYNAATGYDLASGLGTIDANNLVTHWGSVVLGATTTTLTPTINGAATTSFAHGTTVEISGAVNGASPTGDVALVTTSPLVSNQGEDFFTLAGGAYSGSLSSLPGGTYDIYGYYAGDGSNAASSSTPVSITVMPEASTTTLTAYSSLSSKTGTPLAASGGSVTYGSPLTFSAKESGGTSGTNSSYPTGSVVFANGSTVLNTAVVNSEGDAEFNSALSPGSYSVTAKYSGDASYNASMSAATSFTVTKNAPTAQVVITNFVDNNNDAVSSQKTYVAVQLENSASANNFAVAPTGTITVTGAPSGTPTTATLVPANDPGTSAPDGITYFAIPAGATGSHTLNFSYPGDANYSATNFSQQINFVSSGGLTSTTTATATALATSPAAQVQVTVTVSGPSGQAAPTGVVQLISQDYVITRATLPTSSTTSVVSTFTFDRYSLAQGTNQLVVQYSGDNAYNPSATVITIANPLSDFSLVPLNTTIVVPNAGTPAGVQTDTINLASYDGFSGAVALTCTAPTGVTCSLSATSPTLASDGSASTILTVNTTGVTKAGTYNVLVTGKDSTGEYIHTIGLQVVTPLIATPTPSFSLAGGAIAISAPGGMGTSTISATPTNSFTGSIALTCAVTASPAGATGTPTCSLNPTSVTITGAAASSTLTVDTTTTTTAGTYTITVTGVSGSITQTAAVTVTVTGAITSAGTFALSSNPTTVVLASQGASGTSTISVTPNAATPYAGAVGLTCVVTASPSGAASLPTCLLSPASVTLAGATVTSTLTINTTATTTAGTYTVSVTGAANGVTSQTTPVTVVVNGVAAVGTFSLAGSPALVTIPPGTTGTSTISVVPGSTPYAGSVALTCAVTGSPSGATGLPTCSLSPASVTLAGTTLTSTLTIDTSSTTTSGNYLILVTGTPGSGAAQAVSINVTVTGSGTSGGTFALSSAATSITIATQGASGTSTISVTPNATTPYAGAVALTCSVTATPTGATEIPTCSLSPASVTLAGSAMTSTLTINTTAQTTTKLSLPLRGIFTAGGGVALAALFFFGVPVGRANKRALRAVKTLRILSVALLVAIIAGAAMGCGSGSSNGGGPTPTGGTTTGTYTVTVTGTPAPGSAQTVAVTVIVD